MATFEPYVHGKYAVEYDEVDHIYRSVMATGGLLDRPMPPYYHVKGRTMAHLFEYMADQFEDKDAMGWRDIIKVMQRVPSTKPNGRHVTYLRATLVHQ